MGTQRTILSFLLSEMTVTIFLKTPLGTFLAVQ